MSLARNGHYRGYPEGDRGMSADTSRKTIVVVVLQFHKEIYLDFFISIFRFSKQINRFSLKAYGKWADNLDNEHSLGTDHIR